MAMTEKKKASIPEKFYKGGVTVSSVRRLKEALDLLPGDMPVRAGVFDEKVRLVVYNFAESDSRSLKLTIMEEG